MAGARLASDMEGVALDAASFKAVVNKSALMAGLRHEWSAILDDCASTQLRLDTTGCLCTLCKRSDSVSGVPEGITRRCVMPRWYLTSPEYERPSSRRARSKNSF